MVHSNVSWKFRVREVARGSWDDFCSILHASLFNFTSKMLQWRMDQGREEGQKLKLSEWCGLRMELGLESIFTWRNHHGVYVSVLCPMTNNLCCRCSEHVTLSIFSGHIHIVKKAWGRLTAQHKGQEETPNIYWKPTKCQAQQLQLIYLK